MFTTISLRTRLMLLVGFAVANVCAVGVVSVYFFNDVVKTYTHVTQINIPALRSINEARNAQRDLVIQLSVIIAGKSGVDDHEKATEAFKKAVDHYQAATKTYNELPPMDGEDVLRADVVKGFEAFLAPAESIMKLAGSDRKEDVESVQRIGAKELAAGRKAFRESFQALVDFHEAESQRWSKKAADSASMAKMILGSATAIGLALVSLFGFRTATSLTKKLQAITDKIAESSQSTAASTNQVSTASDELASSSSNQAASLQQTAASMEQINAMVTKNADNAKMAQSVSDDSKNRASQGMDVVMAMVTSIERISESNGQIGHQIESSNHEMGEIVKVISEIESKTKVINDIVFQTKLLSFNASVEAARAGEHGKGFAVVAEEVGNLAQMSGSAAESITQILVDGTRRVQDIIQRSSTQIEQLITENKAKLKAGIETAEQCRAVLQNLVENVGRVNGMATDIAASSQEQAHGVKEVNQAMTQLDAVVQETHAASQSLSSASNTLLEQTDVLKSVVVELQQVVKGDDNLKAA